MDDLITVVMPAYNCSDTVIESIESVLEQTYKNFELLIVNDQSTDSTASVLEILAQQDARIKVINHQKNLGVAAARNAAIDCARGRYIAFLDSDDLWHPSKLDDQIRFMKSQNVYFSYTAYSVFRGDDESRQYLGIRQLPNKLDYEDFIQRGYTIGTLSVMLDRAFLGEKRFKKIGHEDFAMWLSLLRTSRIPARKVPGDRALASYRLSPSSVSSSKIKAAMWMWNILFRHEKLNFVSAIHGFIRYAVRASARSV